MIYFLMILVGSVFLGTEIIAVPTPIAQMTIYRVMSLLVIPLMAYFLIKGQTNIKIKTNSYATASIGAYAFWWLWAIFSVLWVSNIVAWAQGLFLLTLGISTIIALYFWLNDMDDWLKIFKVVWVMMTLLMIWGYFEITTGIYFLADLSKLDKYGTFGSGFFSRIPITHFENQNDFAMVLLAYLPVNLVLYHSHANFWRRMIHIIAIVLASYLIFRTGSRMALLCVLLYFVIYFLLQFKWDFKRWHIILAVFLGIIAVSGAVAFVPPIQNTVVGLFKQAPGEYISGDTARINMWRNGLLFLGQTFGLGVGANNIETWMEFNSLYPTKGVWNIHNWWLEILVGYGVVVFVLYIIAYALLVYRLLSLNRKVSKRQSYISNSLATFLIVWIAASITSANNMLIEWHWVFFGLIISYVAILEFKTSKIKNKKDHYLMGNEGNL